MPLLRGRQVSIPVSRVQCGFDSQSTSGFIWRLKLLLMNLFTTEFAEEFLLYIYEQVLVSLVNIHKQVITLAMRIVKKCCSDFVTEERAVEVEKFFASHPCPSAERTIQQAIESISRNVKWLERDEEALKVFLKQCTE